jgi:hypothetical protein
VGDVKLSINICANLPDTFTCPICGHSIPKSPYLHEVFAGDPWAEYAGNLVTHYRHQHVNYYDRSCHHMGYRSKNPAWTNYDDFKKLVNNRAKRQIIRAVAISKKFPTRAVMPLLEGFLKLQYNDEKTIALIKKIMIKIPEGQTTL